MNYAASSTARQTRRACQRCQRIFLGSSSWAYCRPCYRAVRKDSHAAYVLRVRERAAQKQARCARVED